MQKTVFMVMPFQPQLHYTYLYLKSEIQSRFPDVVCLRGDDDVFTMPLLEKITKYIEQADVVIADCTGRNPNVFYELGMAHAKGKPVILVTADDVKEAPTDILAFEFIRFEDGPEKFRDKLLKALSKYVGGQFDELYECVSQLFDEFTASKQMNLAKVSKDDFSASASTVVRTSGWPKLEDRKTIATLFLSSMFKQPMSLKLSRSIDDWIEGKQKW